MTFPRFSFLGRGLVVLSVLLLCAAPLARAEPIAGCDPKVFDAMKATGQARVAADTAATTEIMNKPDSVLAMTCFNQAAGVSAQKGGSIFSGNFTTQLKPVIEPSLSALYPQFEDGVGFESDKVDYGAITLQNTFNCKEMDDLWTQYESEGIQTTAPPVTFDEILSATPPADAGEDFTVAWNKAKEQNIFKEANDTVEALIKPDLPGLAAAEGSCDVLKGYGAATDCK